MPGKAAGGAVDDDEVDMAGRVEEAGGGWARLAVEYGVGGYGVKDAVDEWLPPR